MSAGENFCHFSPSNHMKEGKRKDQKSPLNHFPPQAMSIIFADTRFNRQ